jgi:hypothetical protein
LASTANAQSLPEKSLWKNAKGSFLFITKVDTANSTFRGTFVNYATGYTCEGVPVAISGTTNGSNVSMVANFAPCASTITIWKGTVSGSTFNTNFELRYVDTNYTFQEDKGSDVFTKQY